METHQRTCSIIIPVYNEEDCLRAFYQQLVQAISGLKFDMDILFVDDGSTDATLSILNQLASADPRVTIISLSRNFGHQAALTAGLQNAHSDVIITLDGDGEHPPELIPRMLELFDLGYDIVLGQRSDPQRAGWFKRTTSDIFYRLLNILSDTHIVAGASDYRLLSRHVVDCLNQMPERHRFMRGMVGWVGFNSMILPYSPRPRLAGKSKYTLKRMIRLAQDAIFSFSTVPLRLALTAGMLVLILAMVQLFYVFFKVITQGVSSLVPGWTTLMLGILLIGGVQLVMIGLQGYYIGMIFQEIKRRPTYILRERNHPQNSPENLGSHSSNGQTDPDNLAGN